MSLPLKNRLLLGGLVLAGSLALLTFTALPEKVVSHEIRLNSNQMTLTGSEQSGSRRLRLTFPETLRPGDPGAVRADLSAEMPRQALPAEEPQEHVLVTARLEIPGVQVTPEGEISEPLRPGQPLSLQWMVSQVKPGVFNGTAWVYLRIIPRSGGEPTERAVAAFPLRLRIVNYGGLSAVTLRVLAGIGTAAGLALILPLLWRAIAHLYMRQKS